MCVQFCKGVDNFKMLLLIGGEHGLNHHGGDKLA
jgi:hypothetical protein